MRVLGATALNPFVAIERQRLIDGLSSYARFVVLVGPVGAGATTLLRQWAVLQEGVIWVSAGAIPPVVPGTGSGMPALIIDDADELSEGDWMQIRELRRAAPQLVIRAAVHDRDAIPESDAEYVFGLSFTMPETTQYLASISSDLDPGAVQLATGGLPGAVRALGRLKTLRSALVDAALAQQHPTGLAPENARLAIPEVLTQEVVVGLGGSPDFLDEAARAGLGEWVPDGGHPRFMLTAPVRAATLKKHPCSVEDARSVRGEAGRILLAQEAWFGALVEGVASGSLAIVDAALKGGGMGMLRVHGPTMKVLLRSIPLLELRRWPVIAMTQALIFNARHQHRLRTAELLAITLLGVRNTPAGSAERALLRVIESVARRLLGAGDGGVKAAETAARILTELPADELRGFEGLLGDMHSHSAVSLMYGPRDAAAIAQFEHAIETPSRPTVHLLSYGGIAMIHALSGELMTAQRWVDTAFERPWADSILNEYPGTLLRIAQAKILLERGDLDGADEILDQLWHMISTVEHWPALAHLRAMIDICRGRSGEGLEHLRALRAQRGSKSPASQLRLLDLTESSLMLASGDAASAQDLAARAGDPPMLLIGVARVELFRGQYERALQRVSGITAGAPEVRANRAVLEAIALHRLGRKTEAVAAARRARTIADAHGLSTPFLLITAGDKDLFDTGLSQDPVVAAVPAPRLTEREHVVLRELVHTASVNDIAERLHVSANTVKSQLRTLYRKLGASSREDAVAIAVGHDLLSSDPARMLGH